MMTKKRLLLATLIITGNLGTGFAASTSAVAEAVIATEGAARADLVAQLEKTIQEDDIAAFKETYAVHAENSAIFWGCFNMDSAIKYYAAAIIDYVLELDPERVKEKMPSGKTMRREFKDWYHYARDEFMGRAMMHADNDEYDNDRLDRCDWIAASIAKAEVVRATRKSAKRASKRARQADSEESAAASRSDRAVADSPRGDSN